MLHLLSHFTRSDWSQAQQGLVSPLIMPSPFPGTVGISLIHSYSTHQIIPCSPPRAASPALSAASKLCTSAHSAKPPSLCRIGSQNEPRKTREQRRACPATRHPGWVGGPKSCNEVVGPYKISRHCKTQKMGSRSLPGSSTKSVHASSAVAARRSRHVLGE